MISDILYLIHVHVTIVCQMLAVITLLFAPLELVLMYMYALRALQFVITDEDFLDLVLIILAC